MEERLDAMLQALDTVQPTLETFYKSLTDEQKAAFNRLDRATGLDGVACQVNKRRPPGPPLSCRSMDDRNHSAAMRTSGAAARTSASTCFSYLTKFSWNMRTSLRAVSSNAALSFQVFIG